MAIKPDRIRINMTLEGNRDTYDKTLKQSTEDMETLKSCFETLGFNRSKLKTLSFRIDTKYESYRDHIMIGNNVSWVTNIITI